MSYETYQQELIHRWRGLEVPSVEELSARLLVAARHDESKSRMDKANTIKNTVGIISFEYVRYGGLFNWSDKNDRQSN